MMEGVDTLVAVKALALGAWLALLFALERWQPMAARPPWHTGRPGLIRLARNAGLWVANAALSPLVVVPVSVWAAEISAWRPAGWTGGWTIAVDVLILDAWIYWWHRANHEFQFLWRFHEVHHLDRFLDTTSAVRFHFGEVLLGALVRVPVIVVFDIPWPSVLVFETLVLASALFHHSNLRLAPRFERLLSRVVVTPSIHWVHHHRLRRDTDSNYATVLSIWDPLFGSRSATARTADMPIGVEGRDDRGFLGLLARPFDGTAGAGGGGVPRVSASEPLGGPDGGA